MNREVLTADDGITRLVSYPRTSRNRREKPTLPACDTLGIAQLLFLASLRPHEAVTLYVDSPR